MKRHRILALAGSAYTVQLLWDVTIERDLFVGELNALAAAESTTGPR